MASYAPLFAHVDAWQWTPEPHLVRQPALLRHAELLRPEAVRAAQGDGGPPGHGQRRPRRGRRGALRQRVARRGERRRDREDREPRSRGPRRAPRADRRDAGRRRPPHHADRRSRGRELAAAAGRRAAARGRGGAVRRRPGRSRAARIPWSSCGFRRARGASRARRPDARQGPSTKGQGRHSQRPTPKDEPATQLGLGNWECLGPWSLVLGSSRERQARALSVAGSYSSAVLRAATD